MTILSWNVNGIRAIYRKGFSDWLRLSRPDILCVQETKASPNQLPSELVRLDGYYTYWNIGERKGYSGVGVFTRIKPLDVTTEFERALLNAEGRTLALEYENFYLVNTYCPNGKRDPKRLAHKMAYYSDLLILLKKYVQTGKVVLLAGDINTAHRKIDLARPKENEGISGFLPEERAWIDKLLAAGFIDTFRELHPAKCNAYSWWDMKTQARERNVGWRIDYLFASKNIKKHLKNAFILSDIMGSDHCPVGITVKW